MYKNKKAQVNIISLLLIITISLFFVATTYYWLVPTVKEINSLSEVKSIENQMLDIHRGISQAYREQSQRSLPLNIKTGTLRVRENSLLYIGYHELGDSEKGAESIRYGGVIINDSSGKEHINCSEKALGILGEDEAVCLLRRGNVEIELRYLTLNDSLTGDLYKINFKTSQRSHGSESNDYLVIQWLNKTVVNDASAGHYNITTYMLIEMY